MCRILSANKQLSEAIDESFSLYFSQTSVKKVVLMKNKVMNLKPYALYAFFVETYVLDGEVRKSGIVEIRLSEAGDKMTVKNFFHLFSGSG